MNPTDSVRSEAIRLLSPSTLIYLNASAFTLGVAVDGVAIEWRDAAGMTWNTSQGSGNQDGSRFIITDVQTLQWAPTVQSVIFTATLIAHYMEGVKAKK